MWFGMLEHLRIEIQVSKKTIMRFIKLRALNDIITQGYNKNNIKYLSGE
jgi:hypothetical protein